MQAGGEAIRGIRQSAKFKHLILKIMMKNANLKSY